LNLLHVEMLFFGKIDCGDSCCNRDATGVMGKSQLQLRRVAIVLKPLHLLSQETRKLPSHTAGVFGREAASGGG
jgi:hypothetical protein